MAMPADWMGTAPRSWDVEVVVWDADALLGDACAGLLAGTPRTEILRAIDAGVVVALMSEQAYREIGWVYPRAADGHGVDAGALRDVIECRYLPRTRVVHLPSENDDAWAPPIGDVTDPDDVQHAQLARLVAPASVYSHDKHLRRPGYAPPDRDTYDERLRTLATVTHYRLAATGAVMSANLTAVGASTAVRAAALRLRIKPTWVSVGALLAVAGAVTLALRNPQARRRAGSAAEILLGVLEDAMIENADAWLALAAGTLVRVESQPRLEARTASFLARHPDATITALSIGLGADAPTQRVLRELLESHPSFVATRPYHWALGTVRTTLAT